MFVCEDNAIKFIFVLLYVNDLLVISTSASELEKVFWHLFNCFKIKRASTIEHYLGMNVEVSASSIHLSQSSHIIKMLEHFGFDCLSSLHHHIIPQCPFSLSVMTLLLVTNKSIRAQLEH